MKIIKKSNYTGIEKNNLDTYAKSIDDDIRNIVTVFQGRVRFGDGTNAENISGEFLSFTSDVSVDTEFSVSHSLGVIPIGYLIMYQDKAGSMYQAPTTGTNWTDSTIYLKCDVSSVTFSIFLLK